MTSYKLSSDILVVAVLGRILFGILFLHFLRVRAQWYFTVSPLILIPLLKTRVTETVIVINGLGMQIERKGRYRIISNSDRFIPSDAIRAVFINEVFEGSHVVYVIQMVFNQTNEVGLVFKELRPQLPVLQEVWKSIKQL